MGVGSGVSEGPVDGTGVGAGEGVAVGHGVESGVDTGDGVGTGCRCAGAYEARTEGLGTGLDVAARSGRGMVGPTPAGQWAATATDPAMNKTPRKTMIRRIHNLPSLVPA